MVTYRTVLELKYDVIEWELSDDNDYETLTWPTDYGKPSKEYLDQIIIDETGIRAQEPERLAIKNRLESYPNIGDQLDMLWHDMNNGVIEKSTTFYEAIKAVKDANPKTE